MFVRTGDQSKKRATNHPPGGNFSNCVGYLSRGKGKLQNNPKNKGGDRKPVDQLTGDCRGHPGSSCRAAVTVKVSSMLNDAWLISGPTASFILLRHSQSRNSI